MSLQVTEVELQTNVLEDKNRIIIVTDHPDGIAIVKKYLRDDKFHLGMEYVFFSHTGTALKSCIKAGAYQLVLIMEAVDIIPPLEAMGIKALNREAVIFTVTTHQSAFSVRGSLVDGEIVAGKNNNLIVQKMAESFLEAIRKNKCTSLLQDLKGLTIANA